MMRTPGELSDIGDKLFGSEIHTGTLYKLTGHICERLERIADALEGKVSRGTSIAQYQELVRQFEEGIANLRQEIESGSDTSSKEDPS